MAATKVSIAFLDQSVPIIIKQGVRIAKAMTNNAVFRFTPISPVGLKAAVDHLNEMQKKIKSGRKHDIDNRDSALGDVDDFIRQISVFINQHSFPKEDLLTCGFDLIEGTPKKAPAVPGQASEELASHAHA